MQSLHEYDYFCYRKWNLEGNFAYNTRTLYEERGLTSTVLSEFPDLVCPPTAYITPARSLQRLGFVLKLCRSGLRSGMR